MESGRGRVILDRWKNLCDGHRHSPSQRSERSIFDGLDACVICGAMRLIISLLIATSACASFKPVTRTVRAHDMSNPDRTRLTSRFTWDDVGSKDPEQSPPGTSPAA